MENLSIADLSRMLLAIDHECAIKVKEINLEAAQQYNIIKSDIIIKQDDELKKQFLRKQKEILKEKVKQESIMKKAQKLKIEYTKSLLINRIVEEVQKKVQELPFNISILEEILQKITATEIVVFLPSRDEKAAICCLNKFKIDYEIKELPFEGLGGVIISTKDGKEIWDGSFDTRISIFVEKYTYLICKLFFK
ncbi:V-ATPase V1 sector subunit E [Glugoides intestinalis]